MTGYGALSLFLGLRDRLPFTSPPLPILSCYKELIRSTTIVRTRVVLRESRARLYATSRGRTSGTFVRLFVQYVIVARVVPNGLALFYRGTLPPSNSNLVVVNSYMYRAILQVII